MKNGDPRSASWLARALKEYTRDNEAVQSALMLVDIEPTPSLDEIGTWTDEQCLLATDWAWNAHYRASDNNNRAPAIPEHLKPYQRTYPQKTPKEAAAACVQAMSDDNGACFHPTGKQLARLEEGIGLMQKAGCFFTDAEIQLFSAGEHGELLAHFTKFDGFEIAQRSMNDIFEELDDDGAPKNDEQRVADFQQHHSNQKRST